MRVEDEFDILSGESGDSGSAAGDGSDGSGGDGTSAAGDESQGKRRKREDTTVKTCGTIDGIPVQCAGDSLEDPPVVNTVISSSVVFENKFIDVYAGVKTPVREVHTAYNDLLVSSSDFR